jgi:hypothetical protein
MSKEVEGRSKENKILIHLDSAIAATMVCYGLRLNGRPEQAEFIKKLVESANNARVMTRYRTEEIRGILSKIAQWHFDEMVALKAGIIPEGIALNTPLKENFITMLACFDTLTPLIICGAPGTSKTLCTQIFNSALVPNVIKNCKIFSPYKGINAMYYGGSQTSTSEGISKVFQRGEKYLENKGEDRPVVVFDEIGLAELSPYNPLKILHPLLERVNVEVGFLGLSNWTLDLSKMNRLIYLARPDMTKDDLFEIFKISIVKCSNENIKHDLERFLQNLTVAYLKFRDWQKKYGSHPNFHGSRDIYGVSKFIYRSMLNIKHYDTSLKAKELIKTAIERNFNGAIYIFGDEGHTIDAITIPNLHEGFEKKSLLSMIRIKEFGDPYDQAPDRLDNIQNDSSVTNSSLTIYNSTEVFKKLFMNETARDKNAHLFSKDFLNEYPVLELINQNINDKAARFLLVKSEGEVIDNIFLEKLREFNKSDKIVDWRGIKGKENSIELLSTLKSYISLGYVVVMKNLDELYGSLYDLFNQKYMEVDGRQYCYLYYGENKHRVEVHPDFKTIVILSAEKELEGLDVELEQPAPFLNRFEKFFLRISNVLSMSKIEELVTLRNHLKKQVRGYSSRVLGLSVDMIASMCVSKRDVGRLDEASPSKMDVEKFSSELTPRHKQQIMKLSTLNYLFYPDLSSDELKTFLAEHPYSSLNEVLDDLVSRNNYKLCLMTFSNPMELEPLKAGIRDKYNIDIKSSEEIYNLGLEKRSAIIKNHKDTVFAIQFVYTEHLSLISQIKSNLEQNSKITKVIFICHLERDPKKREKLKTNIGLNYWNDWDNRVLDNLQHSNYKEYCQIKDLPFDELLLSTNYQTGITLLKEACLTCIVKITHEHDELNLRLNMSNIRTMIEKDPENIFINHFREKLKNLEVLKRDKRPWVQILSERASKRDFYVDIDIELHNYFKEQFAETVKNYIRKLNNDLSNIASYSIGFTSPDQEVSQFFKDNLRDAIDNSILNNMSVRQALANIKTESFYRLPFLSPIYKKLERAMKENLLQTNLAEFERLGGYVFKLKIAILYNVAAEHTEQLRARIVNAEQFLIAEMTKMLSPFLDDIEAKIGSLKDRPEINTDMCLDLLSITTLRIGLTKSEEMLQIYKIICAMVNPKSNQDVTSLFATSCLLTIALEKQTMFVFDIMSISNFNANEIDQVRISMKPNSEAFSLNYASMDQLVNFCQERLIPEFSTDLDLRLLRSKYEMLIDRLLNGARPLEDNDSNIYNFRSLINLLSLLDILPLQQRTNYLARLKDIKNQTQRFGSDSHLEFVKNQILLIFFESSDIPDISSDDYCLVLSEHIVINAVMYNFDLFTEKKYDKLFERFSKAEVEKISCTLGSAISKKIPDFFSLATLKKTLDLFERDHMYQQYDLMLNRIDITSNRNMYFVVSLIDNLYIKGMSSPERAFETEFVELLEFIINNADFSKKYKSLRNIIFYALLRVIFNSTVITELLLNNESWRKRVDEFFVENSRSKEYFCNNPNSFVLIYFIQSIIREYGDLGVYQPMFTSINNICTLILDEDVQGTITFMDPTMRAAFIKLRDELDDVSYKKEITKAREIFDRVQGGEKRLQLYMIGVALINKFVNSVKQTDAAVVQNLKNSYIAMFDQLAVNPQYVELLRIIVNDHSFSYTKFMADDNDIQYEIRLRKTFLQFLLIAILFDDFGYNMNAWKDWEASIDNAQFKCKLVNTESINNSCSVCENIITERLSDGSYQDYGANLTRNLGIYRCSCGHIYSIGNCGYAVTKSNCPKCGGVIGGEGHAMLAREGHIHIKTLPEMFQIIEDEYFKNCQKYNMHTVVNHTSLEFFPFKLIEVGRETFMERRKLKGNSPFWQIFFCNLFLRHLFDHMLLTIIPETLTASNKETYDQKMKQIIDFSNPNNKELYGRMSGKEIHSYMEYFLAHVKNDIEILKKELNFENPVDIFDWLRATMTVVVEKMSRDKTSYSGNTNFLTEAEVTDPQALLIMQSKNIQAMTCTDVSTKYIVKSMLFRKVENQLLHNFMHDFKEESESIYQFCRHNKYERAKVFAAFNKQLDTSEFTLLKQVVKYRYVLVDFPRMVKANLDLTYYLMSNYNRIYNFDDANSLDILTLPDPRIKELFNEFVAVWNSVIPKHEEANPEIFSFGYMCQRNLDVGKFINGIKEPGGAIFGRLVFVDSNDYAAQDLLYMKSILETFIKHFHNMFVELINKVLLIKESDYERTLPEFCDESSFMSSYNYEPLVESNFWYNTETSKENEIYFDLKRIEYQCAKAMRKKWINFEEKDLTYYKFKDTNITENELLIKKMLEKVTPIALDETAKKMLDDMKEEQINKSYDFIMEIGEYIYQNFLFVDNKRVLKDIIQSIDNPIVRKRFSSYDEKYHSKLSIGNLTEYFQIVKEKKFDFNFTTNRSQYNKPLSMEEKIAIKNLVEDPNIDGNTLEEIKIKIKDMIREHYYRGEALLPLALSFLGDDFSDMHPSAEFLNDLKFCQYLEISDVLNEGIMVKNKSTIVRRTSSNLYGGLTKRLSSQPDDN